MSHPPSPTKSSQIMVKLTKLSQIMNNINKYDACLIIAFVFVVLAVIALITFAVANSDDSPMEFNITDASITRFNLESDNTLYYDFKLNITVRISNYDLDRNTNKIKAISSYKGNKFAVVNMEPFDTSFKKSISLKPVVFYGNSLIKLDAQQLLEYDNETRLGIFNLDLKLNMEYNEYVYCIGMRVPLISNEKLESFNVTKCSREYQGWS
ncbi:NDR1/HIN1-like protein 10 [Vicia villosa]|uniref:NDR1/HIN1-like protein 10 n=1 Tax=Vicia villosa TaxID=3911 RepID=UPI00273A7BC8|nr:NDR1/HIN1-like protein 10 [Vicia villosa]